MTAWKKYKLREIVTLNYGKSLIAKKRIDGNIPVYSSAGLSGWHDEPLIYSNAIIVGRKGNVGSVFYSNKPSYCIDTAYYILPNDNYDLKFIYYKLLSMNLVRLTSDSAVPGLNRETAYAQEVTIPDLTTQHLIAQILTSFDDKIELLGQMNQTLETMAQTIFKEWFVDFNFPGFDGALVDGLPKGWRKGSIYELIEVTYGFPFKSSLFNSESKGKGLIRIRDLKNNVCGFFTEEEAQEKYLINAGNIVAGMDAEFIPSIWLGEQSWLNQRVCKFFSRKDSVSELFIYYSVKPLLERSQYGKVGTTVIHLGKTDIDRYEIFIPSEDVLQKFKTQSQEIHKKIIANQHQIRTLAHLRDTLLPKLMSGSVAV